MTRIRMVWNKKETDSLTNFALSLCLILNIEAHHPSYFGCLCLRLACFCHSKITIFPSTVIGRGYKIGPVCVCVSVCLSVCLSTLSQLNRFMHGPKIWLRVYFDDITDEFNSQCHKSKVHVDMLKSMIKDSPSWHKCNLISTCDLTVSYDVIVWRHTTILKVFEVRILTM